jgi:hypothetical protein
MLAELPGFVGRALSFGLGIAMKQHRSTEDRAAILSAFLKGVLAHGPVAVDELEVKGRAAGLLGENQKITDAKPFRAAKKSLAIQSARNGFGRGGAWAWALRTPPSTEVAEAAADNAKKVPISVIYKGGHTRPHNAPEVTSGVAYEEGQTLPHAHDRVKGDPVPLEWVNGVASFDQTRAPQNVPFHRWELFVGDCQAFLTSSERWAPRAAELAWNASSLFGCCSVRPLDYFGSAGLLWKVAGGRLIRLHKDWAVVIAAADGTERTVHRRPAAANVTLPWRLR